MLKDNVNVDVLNYLPPPQIVSIITGLFWKGTNVTFPGLVPQIGSILLNAQQQRTEGFGWSGFKI